MERRGQVFGPQVPGPYAEQLKHVVRTSEPDRLLDELLVCGVFEARSCERMGLLADAFKQSAPELSSLYRELVAAEGRHRELYLELALKLFGEPDVGVRWEEITAHEATVLRSIPKSPRLHSA